MDVKNKPTSKLRTIRFQYIHHESTARKIISELSALLSVSKAGYYKWLKQSLNSLAGKWFIISIFEKRSNEEHCIPGYIKL